MLSSENQNQFPSSFAPLGDLLKAPMFLLNLNGFNSSPSLPNQRFAQRKGSSKVCKEKGSKWFTLSLSPPPYGYALLVCFAFLFWVSLVLCFVCFFYVLLGCFSVFALFVFHKKKLKKIYKNSVWLCILVLVYFGWPLKQSFLNFVSLIA